MQILIACFSRFILLCTLFIELPNKNIDWSIDMYVPCELLWMYQLEFGIRMETCRRILAERKWIFSKGYLILLVDYCYHC